MWVTFKFLFKHGSVEWFRFSINLEVLKVYNILLSEYRQRFKLSAWFSFHSIQNRKIHKKICQVRFFSCISSTKWSSEILVHQNPFTKKHIKVGKKHVIGFATLSDYIKAMRNFKIRQKKKELFNF